MKDIAIDEAYFEDIIKENFIYVDKTKFLYNIIKSKKYYFLSRPRRFGKSLTINTLKAIFEGKKELFKGLYIENTDWQWENYPIVHIDFNAIPRETREEMEYSLAKTLLEIGENYDISLTETKAVLLFPELVKKLNKQYNKKVVFLVDEYDKPIISHLKESTNKEDDTSPKAKENREFMKAFYDNLKPLEQYFKTVFITGVSKFSKVSIFSTLNNLIELDTDPEFADMLGYTKEELELYFKDHFEVYASKHKKSLEEVYEDFKGMYNGFRFTEKELKVYNPFSIGRALYYKKMGDYWFESGTPTFLINLIRNRGYDFTKIKESYISSEIIKAYDIENLQIDALLYQTGYLTIKEYSQVGRFSEIKLDFPNDEVKNGFYSQLLKTYVKEDFSSTVVMNIRKAVLSKDTDKLMEYLISIYAGIPYTNQPHNNIANYELHYHNIFYVVMTLVSDFLLRVSSEVMVSNGRADCIIELYDSVYIIEFKCNHSAEDAIKQIKTNGYYKPYIAKYSTIFLIGINFSTEKRNIGNWKCEKYNEGGK